MQVEPLHSPIIFNYIINNFIMMLFDAIIILLTYFNWFVH